MSEDHVALEGRLMVALDRIDQLQVGRLLLREALRQISRKDWHVGLTLVELQSIARSALKRDGDV